MNPSDWTAGDDNVVRLLGQPYDPPSVPADFAQRVQARLLEVAGEMAQQRATPPQRERNRPRWPALAGIAAMFGIIALGLRLLPHSVSPSTSQTATTERRSSVIPNPSAGATHRLAPGAEVATRRGERRRVTLSDGSVLSLNENTRVLHDVSRHLTLKAGEIFVEVSPHQTGNAASVFTVSTPHREVRATGTKFLVRAGDDGTGVTVTQGHVQVNDWDGLLSSGQQLAPKANSLAPTPRLSYLLDWTRDLVVAGAPPLVPPSAYSGGALVAADPQGQAGNLRLRKYHIDVHIEDGFARTTIDQTYFNPTLGRLEGTFFFPLPADASLSRLAMYVDGQLMEGGMVERDYGRQVFDQIVTKMKDPALLEWVDGHTFKMRVFPLEPRQEKRIILSYTQRLPSLYGKSSYRFPAGHSLGGVREWSFHARVKDGKNMAWHSASHTLTPRIEQGDLLLDASSKQTAMERDLTLDLMEPKHGESVRFATSMQDGYRYLMLRYRPDLPGTAKRQRRDWVFLFESSAERDPLLARTQVEIVRTLLSNAEYDDTFAILTAGTRVHPFAATPLRATPENVAAAVSFLEKAHLLGALDLDAGLTAVAEILNHSEHPVLVHLGCGRAVLGERRADVLASRITKQACYVGVGVGKRGASDFMRRAAERCQGYVTEINPDEAVAWRAFDLFAALNTPRLTGVHVEDLQGNAHFLCPNSIVAQGEELCAIARLPADEPLPQAVCVTGLLDGRPFREELRVESPRPSAEYLPRTWARLEIDRMLAEDAVKNKNAIIALSKAMYVMTPYTSLLVLENEAMYAQYKVDRGRKDHWAMYSCPVKIPVVHEPPSPGEHVPPWVNYYGLNQENNELGFFPPAEALVVKASGTIHTRPSNLIIEPYKIQLEPPSIYRAAISVESDAQLQERIRQENRLRSSLPTQWMMNPYQGYVQGGADVTRAQADYWRSIPQAKLTRQEAIRPSLEARRPMIEEAEWERAHMPDPEKIRQQALERELNRARISPPPTDIWSARSLNALLHYLIAQEKQGARGPNVPLSAEILDHINVTVGGTQGSRVNTSVLKDRGTLQWAAVLQRAAYKEARENINSLMKTVYENATEGKAPSDAILRDLRDNLRKMQDTLNNNVDQLTPDEYIQARRYLSHVENAINALKNVQTVRLLNDPWKTKVKTVSDLVRIMSAKGLQFVPATPRDEAAYEALFRALAVFDAGLSRQDEELDPKKVERLLADPVQAKRPAVWRQAAHVAEQQKQYDSALQRLRRALELENNRPRDLPSLRSDFAWFLSLAEQRVQELTAQHRPVPRDLIAWVMAVADQWRAVDVEDWQPCWLAGRLLRLTGEREQAWGYLTSPSLLQHGERRPWLALARQQCVQKEHDFAERAFAVAASLEPSNAEIVWERALNLRAAGRRDAAHTLLEQLDKGTWQERYRDFQIRARRALEIERD